MDVHFASLQLVIETTTTIPFTRWLALLSWAGGLSSQSVRPLWGLTGEARSQPGG